MKKLAILMAGMLIFIAGSGIGTATDIIVEPGNSIQNAVNSASSGDLIVVKPGTYNENIRIITQNLMIRSESANPQDTVITAKDLKTNVITLEQANNISISGFKITGSEGGYSGVYLLRCSNCTITNNDLSDNYQGVHLSYSDYNRILNNIILGKFKGIYLQDSNYNTLSGNRANSSAPYGIHLLRSQWNILSNNIANSNNHGIVLENASYNNLSGNTVNSNSRYGFYLTNSGNCELTDNTVSSNDRGIYLIRSSSNKILGNNVSENINYGILASYSNHNNISGNTANKTSSGISLDSSDGNIVSGNTIALNSVSGLFICAGSDRNHVFNNYMNNKLNADINNTKNSWNMTRTAGKNIIGGAYIGGNFWATPAGTGFSQTAQDVNGDGIADNEYVGKNFVDYLPLVSAPTAQEILPLANFTTNVSSGNAPLAVQFTDTSQYATGWGWDFDNDGRVDSSIQNPVHVYAAAGTYTVSLTASNENGMNSKFMTITANAPSTPVIPTADFITNIKSGYAPLTVQFTDNSQNAVSWSWDFDNDGISDSGLQNPVHVYEIPGTYTVNLIAGNPNGTTSKTATITVLKAENVNNGLPVADFSMNVSEGYAPLYVFYTDLSQNAAVTGWDFDNDGVAEVSSSTIVYVYQSSGTYTVNLIATNGNGTASKTATVNVLKESNSGDDSSGGSGRSSRGSSSGSSGGSSGGSPEPARNVEVKELSQVFITNGNAVKFDFIKNATCVVNLSFDAKKTAGKTTTIIEQLKNKSSLVSEPPAGEVYRYFNVWVGNSGFATSKNIEKPTICFKVEKSWLQDKKIDQSSIALNRYSDKKWELFPVSLLKEDSKYLYFTADVPGYTFFAVTGNIDEPSEENTTEIKSENKTALVEENGLEKTGSQVKNEPGQAENVKSPGPGTAFGAVCMIVVFLYIRKKTAK
ncbi:MAG: NosD domain-containing protein [Euryarchaeota archaeon]|nr:NosD domain-containing protein [Euryarchaeota archaeon]